MLIVLSIMFVGIGAGLLFRKAFAAYMERTLFRLLPKSISWTIYMLLLFLGFQVGANETVINGMGTLGLQAFTITLFAVLGSALAAWLVYRCFFRNGMERPATGTGAGTVPTGPEKDGPSSADAPEGGSGLGGSLVVVAFFAAGALAGWSGWLPEWMSGGRFTAYILYLLMFQVGLNIGGDKQLKAIISGITPKLLLLPLATIIGTLAFSAAASLVLAELGLADCLAVGSGFAYYSLSSILITQIKEPLMGAAFAAQLGTIALLSNIMREIIALLGAPLFYRLFGRFAPICVGGATTMDTTLPIITRVCGKDLVFISIFHGVLVDFSVPFLVTFFAGIA